MHDPDRHSYPALQPASAAFTGTQAVPLQYAVEMQVVWLEQLVGQSVGVQRNWSQFCGDGGAHAPAPVHMRMGVKVAPPQVAAAHRVVGP